MHLKISHPSVSRKAKAQKCHQRSIFTAKFRDTCWFVAADFEKDMWQEDVAAFRETCKSLEIPIAVERSRSGNGAHVWFFFAEPVPAALARTTVCYLITETMSRRHHLSLNSYDRLIPSKDSMPRGGFGNLIALPLYLAWRQFGNSVFICENFCAISDQWTYLATVCQGPSQEVKSGAEKAVRQGQVIGLPTSLDEDEEQAPWERSPSSGNPARRVTGKLPKEVTVIFAQQIFVAKEGLPSAMLAGIKCLAAFQHPESYKKQKMRLFCSPSTAGTLLLREVSEISCHSSRLSRCAKEIF